MQLLLLPPPPPPPLPLVLLYYHHHHCYRCCCYKHYNYNRKHNRCLYPPCGPKRSFSHHRTSCPRAVSVYQQCAAANASDTRDCDYIFLDKATVDCLAGSGTPLIVHYRRCLETACGVDTSAMAPTLAYIKDNCDEEGEVLGICFRFFYSSWVFLDIIRSDNTSQLFQTCGVIASVLIARHNSFRRVVWYHP